MAKIRVKFSSREIREILKRDEVRKELHRRAELIHAAVGHEGYEVASGTGKSRARAAVITVTQYARRSNAIHNTLVKNIGAGRG